MTVELFSNITQTIAVFVSIIFTAKEFIKNRKREYFMLLGMLVSYFLGITYWLAYQALIDVTPQVFYVSDISWTAGFLFLLSLEIYFTTEKSRGKRHFAMYIPLPFIVGITVYFCLWGDILLNITYMLIIGFSVYFAIKNWLFQDKRQRPIHSMCIIYILTQYALWISSCFWISDTLTNPYFWFDFAITIEICLFLPMLKKVVEA